MSHLVGFPGLGIGPFELNPVAFTVFGFDIRWYGILIFCGLLLGMLYFAYRTKQEGFTLDDVLDIAIFAIPSAIIGARLYYVLTSLDQFHSFYDVIAIWKGGIAIYGSIIGGFIAVVCVCKFKKLSLVKMLDSLAPALMIGQIIGRWGNFVNAEAFGVISQYDFFGFVIQTPQFAQQLPLRMTIAPISAPSAAIIVHPTFLYESVWNLIGFLLIHFHYKKKRYNGEIILQYLTWYGFGRCLIEGFREDSLWAGGIRISQLVGLLCFVVGGLALIVCGKRAKAKKIDAENDAYTKLFEIEPLEESKTNVQPSTNGSVQPKHEPEPSNAPEENAKEQNPKGTDASTSPLRDLHGPSGKDPSQQQKGPNPTSTDSSKPNKQ